MQLTLRRATEDVELPGGKVRDGEMVALLLASANRDDRQFPGAHRLDLHRDARGHLGFGFGTHFCVGAGLARLETRAAFEVLLRRLRGIERIPAPIEYTPSLIVRGPACLPLRFTSATAA